MKKIRFIWVVLLLLCLSACAKEKVSEQGTYGTEESTVDWRGQEFQVQENVANNQTIWMDKFNLIDISDMLSSDESVFMSIYLGQFGEKVYYLYELYNKESQNSRYACVSVNLTDMTRSVHSEFTMSDIGYMAPYYLVFGACMPEEGILMLDLEEGYYNADEELVRNRYWSYIEDKKIVKQMDMTSFVKDNDLFLDAGFIGNGENQVYLADDGCIYYLPMDKYYDVNFLYVFDGEGNLLNQYQKPQNSKFRSPIRTQDGDYLFPIYMNHEKRVDMVYYDKDSNSVRKLGGIEDNGIMKPVVMHGSRIYYISENKVISWDVVTGDRTECCNLTDLGYYNNSSLLMLWCNAKPYIRFKDAIERRETGLAAKEEEIKKRSNEVEKLTEQRVQELERISGLTSEQAKEYLLKTVEDEVKHDTAKLYKELESRAKEEAGKKAKEYVVNAIQKCAADHVAETTISVVQLPNDEMKGRIIGREGRNIRTLETMTGVDLIIDDTPEAVILSGFDPIRREVARIALEKLIVDGRIHPARIEEMVEKAQKEVENMIREEGEAATLEVGVHGIHPELVRLLGRMKFRTSYGQNALKHSIEVAQLSGLLAGEIGVDVRMAKRAGLLHDIGKSIDHEVEGSHIQIGADLCKKYKESPLVINAVEAHHGDVEPESLIACIVQAADTISAARPGARRETLETYTNRLKQLEDITNSFKGVDKSFAIQAGREIRIMVVPEQVSDADMVLLARDVAKQIEAELEYPGQIKVSVIRESRAVDYAK